MRISGGKHKNRRIATSFKSKERTNSENLGYRPTAERTRQAIFNIIENSPRFPERFLIDATVADVFCGSGSFGMESLSRGAKHVYFLDASAEHIDLARQNITHINETQNVNVGFPLIADEDRTVANLYDMIHPNASATMTVRSLFIIGPDKTIKLIITYPASTGRNFQEVLRVLDSLQLTSNYSVSTPADWKDGEDVIIGGAISTEDAYTKFPKGVKIVKPYLRYTPQPNK